MDCQELIKMGVRNFIRGDMEDDEDEQKYFLRMSECKSIWYFLSKSQYKSIWYFLTMSECNFI